MPTNTDTLTRAAILLALSAAIRSLSAPVAAGGIDHDSVVTTALHIQTLADLAHGCAEGLLSAV
jgi:3-polyprenyl-4-hydroxybenzoate decarboxylase